MLIGILANHATLKFKADKALVSEARSSYCRRAISNLLAKLIYSLLDHIAEPDGISIERSVILNRSYR